VAPWLNRLTVFPGSPTIPRASMLALPSGWIFSLSVSEPGCPMSPS